MADIVAFLRERLPTFPSLWDHVTPQHLCFGMGKSCFSFVEGCGMRDAGVFKRAPASAGDSGFDSKPRNSQQNNGNRLLLFLVILFALVTVALAVVLAITVIRVNEIDEGPTIRATTSKPSPPVPTQPVDVCLTEGCVLAAAKVRNSMDPSVKPCDDFYQFACGSWLKKIILPEDKSYYKPFSQLRDYVAVKLKHLFEVENKPSDPEVNQKARDFYKGCLNEENIEERGVDFMLDYMEELGRWPIMGAHKGGNWDQSAFNLEDLLILIDQTSLGMPSRDYYLKGRNNTMLMAYQKMRTEIAVAFGADRDTAEEDTKNMVDFEIELANITMQREDRLDPEKLYNKMTVGDLSKMFTGLDWVKLVKGTFRHINMDIDETEPVIVRAPTYFEKLMGVLNKYPARVIANYIAGHRIYGKTYYLPVKFRDIVLQYKKVLLGKTKETPRWRSCSSTVVSGMPEVAGRLFVEEYFKKAAKKDVLLMIENLRESFKEMITDLDWMEDKTKMFAKDKVDLIEPRIGYPDWIWNETRLREKYELVTVRRDDPLRTSISFIKASVQHNLHKLRKDYDKSVWYSSATSVNAYYQRSSNQITFPAGILQPPFYGNDRPAYLNYGGIGSIIGHEITHGFDNKGRLYDKMGKLNSWWSKEDEKKFKKKAQCMIDQYGSYVVPGTGNMTINGVTTLDENIADNGGLKESFKAYRKWVVANGREEPKLPGLNYTGNQLFFLNAAQMDCEINTKEGKILDIQAGSHSFDMFRVFGPLQNSVEFSKAFGCRPGSFMNPFKKCEVW